MNVTEVREAFIEDANNTVQLFLQNNRTTP